MFNNFLLTANNIIFENGVFDFHHHKNYVRDGIYNLNIGEIPPDIPYSIGIHPNDIDIRHKEQQVDWLRTTMFENCFAIGECGLDSLVPIDQKIQEDFFYSK